MIIDCHVHVSACTPGCGIMSPRLMRSLPFQFMQWKFGVRGATLGTQVKLEQLLVETINDTTELDAAVVLAFDAVHTRDGVFDTASTHLYVTNDYVIELTRRHRKILFGASVHPYRKDAVDEIERCVKAGAVLLKWLPIVQNFNPADENCIPFYEALAHHKLPLLAHTGGEQSLPTLDRSVADPILLKPALDRGVTVIMAHCGTKSTFTEPTYVQTFARLAKEYENCFGDTSALNLPARWHAYDLLKDPIVREKLVHGSDWPIMAIPPFFRLDLATSAELMMEKNWMKRDIEIKKALGFDDAYWQRAAKLLNVNGRLRLGAVNNSG
jgi:predicted TIM-barrel fold metal-dependent hydrolase